MHMKSQMWIKRSKRLPGGLAARTLAAWLAAHVACAAEAPGPPHFWDEIPACPSTTAPAKIQDGYWQGQFERVNREVATAKVAELVFFGDSITWHWSLGQAVGRKVWNEAYGQYHPINMGNSGDITPVMLYRVTHGNLAFATGQEPKVAVLLCGTNNFVVNQSDGGKVRWDLGPDCPPEDVAAGMRAVAQAFRRSLPLTRVIMMGILPVKQADKWTRCQQVNKLQASLACDRDELVFLDAGKNFLQADGSLDPKLFTDGTHLTEDGYRTWVRSIDPVMKEMLKADPLDPVRIMLIGDALTEGSNPAESYRRYLDGLLRRKGHLIDFVGNRKGHHEEDFTNDRFAYDPDHEGHWGRDSKWLAENIQTMLSGKVPDAVVLQLGSTEIAGASGDDVTDKLVPNLGTIVAALRSNNPQVRIVLTTMIPLPGKAEAVRLLNQGISSYAGTHSTEQSPLVVADLTDGFETSKHLAADGARPTASGAKRMAEALASAIDPLLGDGPP
jgi:lysophospholipase L1-like esterase